MTKYYVYHCSISEIDPENNEVNSLFEAHTEDNTIHTDKHDAFRDLRDILDGHCEPSLRQEIDRLNRVVTVLDRKVADAVTVSV